MSNQFMRHFHITLGTLGTYVGSGSAVPGPGRISPSSGLVVRPGAAGPRRAAEPGTLVQTEGTRGG
eukprot:763069-Hanusia_phi.AAC.3